MRNRASKGSAMAKRILRTAAGMAALAGPVLVGMMNAPFGRAQTEAALSAFEVASVKQGDPYAKPRSIQFTPGGGIRIEHMPLKVIIMFAYDVQGFQISGGPAWLDSDVFEIIGKAPMESGEGPRDPTVEQRRLARQRLQALLAERFNLIVRREAKELPVYALTVAKNGPRLKESTGESLGVQQSRPGELVGTGTTIVFLAGALSRLAGRPVLDKTDLAGRYDFRLEWTPEPGSLGGFGKPAPIGPAEGGDGAGAHDLTGPSLASALQQQLGLKLESQKGPLETIVVERVERPTAN
jgi:bla regulator protein blaR1